MSKAPLENIPQERAVLGALLADTRAFWTYKERVRPGLFALATHIRIAEIMHALHEGGREVTIPAVVGKMPDGDEDWSPAGYLATLVADEAEPEDLSDNIADLEQMWGRRQMMKLGADLMRQATEDSNKDVAGRLEAAMEQMEGLTDPASASLRRAGDIAEGLLHRVQEASMNEQIIGLDVGLAGLQQLIGQLMPSRLYLVPGSSGSGKSALAQQVAGYVSEKHPVLYFQHEMEDEEMIERELASETGITADRIERAAVNDTEMEKLWGAAMDMRTKRLFIDARTNLTVPQMLATAMRMQRMKGLAAIFIDHLLLVRAADKRKGEFEGLRANLQAVKQMAKKLKVPVVLLTQLKGSYGEGGWQQIRKPTINDIYGGSANEHDPDVILFVYREEYLLRTKEPPENDPKRAEWEARLNEVEGTAQLILAKRRGGKGAGTRTVFFDGPRTRFSDSKPKHVTYRRDEPDLLNPAAPADVRATAAVW